MPTPDISAIPDADILADLNTFQYKALFDRFMSLMKRYGKPGMTFFEVMAKAGITDQNEVAKIGGSNSVATYLTKNKFNPWSIDRVVLAKAPDHPNSVHYYIWFRPGSPEFEATT